MLHSMNLLNAAESVDSDINQKSATESIGIINADCMHNIQWLSLKYN